MNHTAAQSYKEKERYLFSFILAIVIHLILFLAISVFLIGKANIFPEYADPLTIEITGESAEEAKIYDPVFIEKEKKQDNRNNEDAVIEHSDNTGGMNESDGQLKNQTPATKEDIKTSSSSDTGDKKNIEESAVNRDDTIQTDIKEKTDPALSPTEEPYVPGLEQKNLSQLDTLLEQDGSKTDADTSSKETGNKTDKTKNQDKNSSSDKETEFVWEDNQNRKPLITKEPEIPAWVSEQRLKLIVIISFLLTPDGILSSLRVEQSSGYTLVDTRVIDALRKWKFQAVPGTKNVRGQISYFINIK